MDDSRTLSGAAAVLERGGGTFLGPARVLAVEPGRVRVALPGGDEAAAFALPYPYAPEAGDVVLVIGEPGNRWVIGVVEGRGTTRFSAPGSIAISAPRGAIDLVAADGVRLRGPRVRLEARDVEVVAQRIVQRCTRALWRIREALHVAAERVDQRIKGTSRTEAARIVQRATGDVHIDGDKIHLG